MIEFGITDTARKQLLLQHGINAEMIEVVVLAWMALLGDTPSGDVPSTRQARKFFHGLLADYKGMVKNLSELALSLMRSEQACEDGTVVRHYLASFQALPIYREYLKWFRTGDSTSLQFLLSFLTYGKKIPYKDEQLEATALREWLKVEERLESVKMPPFVDNIRIIFEILFRDAKPYEFWPSHGPGAVAEETISRFTSSKNAQLAITKRVEHLYLRKYTTEGCFGDELCVPTPTGDLTYDESLGIARLLFVHKDLSKMRSICEEPSGNQWGQQSDRLWIEEFIATNSILRRIINLTDQGWNQEGAYEGSISRLMDTLDLSSASDSVLWALVKRIFPTSLTLRLAATRSCEVRLPNGQTKRLAKYAPMGSATCFPVQCLVYTGVILYASICRMFGLSFNDVAGFQKLDVARCLELLADGTFPAKNVGRALELCRVFGDDLIVDNAISDSTIQILTTLGFQVNETKSFRGDSTYRESCGKHYSNGGDVTPLTLKVRGLAEQPFGIRAVAGLVDHTNLAYDLGYNNLRRFWIRFLLYHDFRGVERDPLTGKNRVLFSSDRLDSVALYHPAPTNRHLIRRDVIQVIPDSSKTEANYVELWRSPWPHTPWPGITDFSQFAKTKRVRPNYQRVELCSVAVGRVADKVDATFDGAYYHQQWWRVRRANWKSPEMREIRLEEVRDVVPVLRWTRAE